MSEPPHRREDAGPPSARWHEYPTGVTGELAAAARRTLLAALAGLAVTAGLAVLVGWVGEEPPAGFPELDVLEWVRHTVLIALLAGYLVVLLVCLMSLIEEVACSRALAQAARRGAEGGAVPAPAQLHRVVSEPGEGLVAFAVLTIVVGVVAVLGITFVAWTDTFYDSMAVALVGILGYSLILAGALGAVRWLIRPAHQRWRERIAAHWPAEAEHAAWRRAREGERVAAMAEDAGQVTGERQRIRWGVLLQYAGGGMLVAAYVALYVLLTVAYRRPPTMWSRFFAERQLYGEDVELLLRTGFVIGAAAVTAGIVMIILGLAMNGAVHERERSRLRAALQDPSAPHPQLELVHRHTGRTPVPAASVLAVLGAMALTGAAGAWRADAAAGASAGAGAVLMALGGAVAIVLAAVWQFRGGRRVRGLRNELRSRWPVPPPPEWSGGAPVPSTVGPVLHPGAIEEE